MYVLRSLVRVSFISRWVVVLCFAVGYVVLLLYVFLYVGMSFFLSVVRGSFLCSLGLHVFRSFFI